MRQRCAAVYKQLQLLITRLTGFVLLWEVGLTISVVESHVCESELVSKLRSILLLLTKSSGRLLKPEKNHWTWYCFYSVLESLIWRKSIKYCQTLKYSFKLIWYSLSKCWILSYYWILTFANMILIINTVVCLVLLYWAS